MTLDEFIQARISAHVSDLGRLSAAANNECADRKKAILLEHLRDLFRLRKSAFSPELIENVKKFSQRSAGASDVNPLSEDVEGKVNDFEVGKKYLSQHGVFTVRDNSPYPIIDPPLYPKCQTPYFAGYMLDEHNRLVEEVAEAARAEEAFAQEFNPPENPANKELEAITASYHSMVEENHRKFLLDHGKPDLGTQSTGRKLRVTHCYSCQNDLDNELYMECRACGWIICSCGACGCGYVR